MSHKFNFLNKFFSSINPLLVASICSLVLALIKIITFAFTGSLVVLASFLDSISDSAISFLNTKIQKISKEKPDQKHPFGHGGIEVLSGLIQGSIILAFGLTISFESLERIFSSSDFLRDDNLFWGFIVLVVGAVFGFVLNLFLKLAEHYQRSQNDTNISISTDRAHYEGDFWFNFISAIGMCLVWLTGLSIIDSLCALGASFFFIKATFPVFKRIYEDILNQEAPIDLQNKIKDLIYSLDTRISNIHDLRSRFLGPNILIDCHLNLPSDMSVKEASLLINKAQSLLYDKLNVDALIHVDSK